MKFGLAIRRGPIDHVLHQGKLAAEAGFDSIWYMDHWQGLPLERHVLEPFTLMAALTQHVGGTPLGIVATDTYRRPPALLAQLLGTIGLLSGNSMSLALGSGEAMNLRPFGLPEDRPIERLHDMFPAIRGLTGATPDRRFTRDSAFHRHEDAFLQLPGAPAPTLYLAGNGPRNRHAAGTLADGWIPLMISADLYASDLAEIRSHGEAAGRDMSGFDAGYQLDFALADNRDAGRDLVLPIVRNLLLAFPRKARRLGIDIVHTYDWHDLLPLPGITEALVAEHAGIDPSVADRTSVFGSPSDCLDGIERFREAGCRHLIIRSVNPVEEACAFFAKHVFPRYRA